MGDCTEAMGKRKYNLLVLFSGFCLFLVNKLGTRTLKSVPLRRNQNEMV